ncbi:MAG: LPS export ABC transporter periplasmic protein LptC [Deltaproteobacteria bacterium]|jgi:LPS export ABC transporter protein LptC|nr:MAG: LPS export ABC transporter periplasmic protein LptC [Deltaproteobacteria bacterium]
MRKARRTILLLAILLSLGGVGYKATEFVQRVQKEIKKNPLKALDYLPESALHMKEFHRAKIENGRKLWELFGDEASYFKEQKEAIIKKPRFYYYDKKGEVVETTGDLAHLYINEKELERMELRGDIQVSFQGYVLKSEEANYLPAKDQVILPNRTTVVGEGIELEGSSMEIELEDRKIRLVHRVKTKIEPEKVAKKKNKPSPDQRVGG